MIRLSASAIGGANIPAEFRQKIGLDNRGDGIVVLNGPDGVGRRRWVTRGVVVVRQRAHRRCPRCGELSACD
jgi:hypothetical protein